MRALWRGSISFGLINVPVKMYAATEKKNVNFRQIHKECNTPIKYEKMCPRCNRKITEEEIARGYEYEKGKFVIIDEKDLEDLPDKTKRTIDIVDFVSLDEIDPIYYSKSYFLGPEETSQKAYTLLNKAMQEKGKIAIAKVKIRNRQSLACLRPYNKSNLIMETMFYPDEVRNVEDVPKFSEITPDEKELEMATKLIESLATTFDPQKYTDDYRIAMLNKIREKVEKEDIKVATPDDEKVVDLMEALKASLAIAEKQKKEQEKGKSAASK